MALTRDAKDALIKKYGKDAKDTGSIEVQIAILTAEIDELNAHFTTHIHDFESKRGLMKKIGHRRSLLAYLKKTDLKRYEALTKSLGLRK